MSEEILINVTPQETRVAVVENGVLQEVHIERTRSRGIVGNIYKGKVVRVLPGMQAEFVDIRSEPPSFLLASDIRSAATVESGTGFSPPIHELLRDGQEIVVHVVKAP